jgi:hypothetical protein
MPHSSSSRPACFGNSRDPYTGQTIALDRCRLCVAAEACALMRTALAQEAIAAEADDWLRERQESRQAWRRNARR